MSNSSSGAMEEWKATEGAKYGIALYNFDGNVNYGLQLDVGDAVHIFETCEGWYHGYCLKNKAVKGIFPSSYVRLEKCTVENLGTPLEVITPCGDATILEVTAVLREWLEYWKSLFQKNSVRMFKEMTEIMCELIGQREAILSGYLTQTLLLELKASITSKIDFWNSKMGLDLVPRVEGVPVDVDKISVVELHKIHQQSLKKTEIVHQASIKVRQRIRKSGQSMRVSTPTILKTHRHLLLSVTKFDCNADDKLECFFSLYDALNATFISERFMLSLDKDALPNVGETLSSEKTKTLFTDLGRRGLNSHLYIVCQVVRTGQMHLEQTLTRFRKTSPKFRRPFALGVFNVERYAEYDENDAYGGEKTFSFNVFLTTSDANFGNAHEDTIRKLINKNSGSYSAGDSIPVTASLRLFNGERDHVIEVNPLRIPADISISRKLGFADVILPDDVRNDLYITLARGEFDKGGKGTGRNVEVTVSVMLSNGVIVENCIYAGCGSKPVKEYHSLILYHNNNPVWNETIKLKIPVKQFQDCHILFVFKHCPTASNGKVFGFSFLKPLKPDGTTIFDGSHKLVFYKSSLLEIKNPGKYLAYPSSVPEIDHGENQHVSSKSTKETFVVSTLTCSTKLTRNLTLVDLLKWKQHKQKIPQVLNSLREVPEYEIVKFLQDILDALFAILHEATEESGLLVFKNLVFIVNLLLDGRYQQFQPVLNTYITNHFSAALVHKHIIILFNKVMSVGEKKNETSNIANTAKVLHYVIKFIIQSWTLNLRNQPNMSDIEFKRSIRDFFNVLNGVMKNVGYGWKLIQSDILLNIPKVYKELASVFSDDELVVILQELFRSAQSSSQILDKLNFLDGLISSSPLCQKLSCRKIFMPMVLNCLLEQLKQKNELKACADILGNLLSCLSKVKDNAVTNDVKQLSSSLLQVVFQAVVAVDRSSSRAGQYVAILFTLLKIMNEENYKSYIKNSFENKRDLKDFLNKVFGVFTNLLYRNIYPEDWFVMKIEGYYVILSAVLNFSFALTENFLEQKSFDYQLWSAYFHLAINFVSHQMLDLSEYSEAKRSKILERYGDMRLAMAFNLVRLWNALGDLQGYFVPSMIEPFLEMTLVKEPVLRKETIPLFYDMMDKEMRSFGHIKKVEEEYIDKLDICLSKKGMGDEEYKDLFEKILTEKIMKNSDLEKPGILFVTSVTNLLDRLLDYRKVISMHEECREMKMGCIVNLLNYYEKKGKTEMFLRYVEKLYELHLLAENHVEAGFTLFLYASCLKFDDVLLPAEDNLPSQTERARKEILLKKSMDLLKKGQMWESAIRICKVLVHEYEFEVFDFVKLSEILQLQAEFYTNIMTKHRVEPSYFRVCFYGKGFPTFLQNKQFVYRGGPVEQIGEFCFRIQREYPDAEVLRHNNPLDDDLLSSQRQYIQCCKVEPIANFALVPPNVHPKICSYYNANWIDTFELTRPFRKFKTADKSNEFANLWCEVTTLRIETRLPCILSWYPVVSCDRRELSPIENAINSVKSKTRQLEQNIEEILLDDSKNINPLSMQLKGVIDAAVNGGISNYQKAFFTPEFAGNNPKRKSEVNDLSKVMLEQVGVLRRGLILHEKRISPDLLPLHKSMLNQYNNMLNDLPGDNSEHVLIQRKSSLPMNHLLSESSVSLDKRNSNDIPETGTLRRLFQGFSPRKAITSVFAGDNDGNRQSTLSAFAMKTSSSLLSITELEKNSSVSVPDLREDQSRPKLPQKVRVGKRLNDGNSSPSFYASRVSVGSSVSETSLNEMDEKEENEAIPQDNSVLYDSRSNIRKSSLQFKQVAPITVSPVPRIPPKTLKKRQSNVFELASNGEYRVFKNVNTVHSKSLDDLDKIEDGSPLSAKIGEHKNFSETKISDRKKSEDLNVNAKEEEPPPLLPRKAKTRLTEREDGYDTLAIRPNLARPRENLHHSAQTEMNRTYLYKRDPLKPVEVLKHRYANLNEDGTSIQPQGSTGRNETYDVLALPVLASEVVNNNETEIRATRTGIVELNHTQSRDTYDTSILRDERRASVETNDKSGISANGSHDNIVADDKQPSSNSFVIGHHISTQLNTSKSMQDPIAENGLMMRDPELPIESQLKKTSNESVLLTEEHSKLLTPQRSASVSVTPKSSPPVAPRIKRPRRTAPNNNAI